jgi:recombination protein RecA
VEWLCVGDVAHDTESMVSIEIMREDLQAFLARAHAHRMLRSDQLAPGMPIESLQEPESAPCFSFEALRGRFIEISASGSTAVLSAAVGLVVEAQLAAEPVAWVTLESASFYPPDVVDSGADISAMVVVRTPSAVSASRAVERLLRSAAFGLVILDLGAPDCVIEGDGLLSSRGKPLSIASQGRLSSLAQQNNTLVVCLTEKKQDLESIGSLISLRADAARERDQEGFCVTLRILKDKRRGPGWSRSERAKGPAGLT